VHICPTSIEAKGALRALVLATLAFFTCFYVWALYGPLSPTIQHDLKLSETEAAVVRRIFEDFVAGGYSLRRICWRLSQDGILSPTGKKAWTIASISQMLRNPTFKGRALYNRHESIPSKTGRKSTRNRLRPPEEWIEIPVPAIIGEELFEAAQRVSRDHSYFSPRRSRPDQWLLRRLVVCGHCGVRAYCQGNGKPNRARYYVCGRQRSIESGGPDRDHRCPQPTTRAEELEALTWEHLCQALLRPDILMKGEAALSARSQLPDDELLTAQLERLQRRLQRTESERRRVVDLYQMQAIELAEFQARHQEVLGRHRQLGQEREALVRQRRQLTVDNGLRRKVVSFASRTRRGIDALDFEQRQKLVRLLVEQVRVTAPQVEIHLRIPLDEPAPTEGAEPGDHDDGGAQHVSSQLQLRSLGRNQLYEAGGSARWPVHRCVGGGAPEPSPPT
jgi:site-specific DNA recombinase